MTDLVPRLNTTLIAKWYEKISGLRGGRPRHYGALQRWLDDLEPGVVLPTGEAGRRELARRLDLASSSSLYRALHQDGDLKLKVLFPTMFPPKSDIVDTLVAETKIWDYWPYRVGWLRGLTRTASDQARFAATTMIQVLADWANGNPHLATATECMPPLAAVEDLCTIVDRHMSEQQAARLLTEALRYAAGPLGVTPTDPVDMVYEELMGLGFERDAQVKAAADRLMPPLIELEHLMSRLSQEHRARMREHLEPQYLAIKRLVDEMQGG